MQVAERLGCYKSDRGHTNETVLHVLGTLNPGGVETWLMTLARRTGRDRIPFDVCLTSRVSERGRFASEFESLGGHIWHCPVDFNLYRFDRQLRYILRRGGYSIVHSHVHHFSGFILRSAMRAGVRIRIAHSHNDTRSEQKAAGYLKRAYFYVTKRMIRRYATTGLACSDEAACALYGSTWKADARWSILPYGIDYERFRNRLVDKGLKKKLGIPPEYKIIGHVGRFHKQKNHDFIVDIAAKIKARDPKTHFVLVGDGPEKATIERKVRQLRLHHSFTFLDNSVDVPSIMCDVMDAFLFPSRYEGLGIVLLEAQAAGLPCVYATCIPDVAVQIPEHCVGLSLSDSIERWAEVCLTVKAQLSVEECVRRLDRSDAAIPKNLECLSLLYGQ